jgi:hypothetical protein
VNAGLDGSGFAGRAKPVSERHEHQREEQEQSDGRRCLDHSLHRHSLKFITITTPIPLACPPSEGANSGMSIWWPRSGRAAGANVQAFGLRAAALVQAMGDIAGAASHPAGHGLEHPRRSRRRVD